MAKARRVVNNTNESPGKRTRAAQAKADLLQATKVSKPPRAPQRCRRCPDAPLRETCIHSKKGKAKALDKEADIALQQQETSVAAGMTIEPGMPFVFRPPSHPPVTPNRPKAAQTTSVSSVTPTQKSPVRGSFEQTQSPRTSIRDESRGSTQPESSPFGFTPMTWGLTQPESSPLRFNPMRRTPGPNIDPQLLTPECGGMPGPSSLQTSTPSSAAQKKARVRANASHPLYGTVKGVYRGSDKHNIVRRKAKPAPIIKTSLASKTFIENVNALVEKCEDIAIKTGAWLFFGVQHPVATGGPINYASPRLKRDGGDEANELATSFVSLINTVMASKRTDTRELQQELADQKKANEDVTRKLQAALMESEMNRRALEDVREALAQTLPVS